MEAILAMVEGSPMAAKNGNTQKQKNGNVFSEKFGSFIEDLGSELKDAENGELEEANISLITEFLDAADIKNAVIKQLKEVLGQLEEMEGQLPGAVDKDSMGSKIQQVIKLIKEDEGLFNQLIKEGRGIALGKAIQEAAAAENTQHIESAKASQAVSDNEIIKFIQPAEEGESSELAQKTQDLSDTKNAVIKQLTEILGQLKEKEVQSPGVLDKDSIGSKLQQVIKLIKEDEGLSTPNKINFEEIDIHGHSKLGQLKNIEVKEKALEGKTVDPGAVLADNRSSLQEALNSPREVQNIPTASEDFKDSVISQLVKKFEVIKVPDKTEIKVQLKPEHLGEVTLLLVQEKGTLKARLIAESLPVKEALEAGMAQIKNNLEAQGIKISEVNVTVNEEGGLNHQENSGFDSQAKEKDRLPYSKDSGTGESAPHEKEDSRTVQGTVNYLA